LTHPDPGVQPPSSTVGKTARNARAGPSTSPVHAPPYHPGTCGGVTPRPPIDFNESMALYAGKYKFSSTVYSPHCAPNAAPAPYAYHDGWFQMHESNIGCNTVCDCCNEICNFDILHEVAINCHESNNTFHEGYPNNSNGGCDRNFEEYYTSWIERHRDPIGDGGRYTMLLHSTAIETFRGIDPWVKITFSGATMVYPGSPFSSMSLRNPTHITSNLPDIMNEQLDIFRPSAYTQIDKRGNEVAVIGENPNYYYIFLEEN